MISKYKEIMYILRHEPSSCNFHGCIQEEWLAYSTDNLSNDHENKIILDHAPNSSAKQSKNRTDNNPFLDAFHIKDPIRREIDQDVNNHVRHWND